MSNVSDKSFICRSYPKLAYGSIHAQVPLNISDPSTCVSLIERLATINLH